MNISIYSLLEGATRATGTVAVIDGFKIPFRDDLRPLRHAPFRAAP
jgi:hypothetical protein